MLSVFSHRYCTPLCHYCTTSFHVIRHFRRFSGQSSWRGFYTPHQRGGALLEPMDRQKVQGFLRRSASVGFCSPGLPSVNELCTQADQNMFSKVLNNTDHVLRHLLTPVHNTSHSYLLRPRAHDRELPDRLTHLTDCNFIIRMLFYQVY